MTVIESIITMQKEADALRSARVMVSPTGTPSISLIPAITKPTSPVSSTGLFSRLGAKTPTLSTWYTRPVDITYILSLGRIEPFLTRIREMTPT